MEPRNVYMVMMEYDSEYQRLKADRYSASQLDVYVSNKHEMVLQKTLEEGTYQKHFSWVIVDGFAVEMTTGQAEMLRSAEGVRAVVKDREIGL